jgi:hypothetical protein
MDKRTFLKTGLLSATGIMIATKSRALEYYPRVSDRKWAVIYSTWCGSTRDASLWISEGMDGIANVFDVREDPDPSRFDHIIVGGAIRSGKISPLMQEYLERHREMLSPRLRGYFAVCGNMMQPVTPERHEALIDNHIATLSGVKNLPSKVFLGRITIGLMEPDVRESMLQMPGIKEYDNLKRAECMAFGKEVFERTSGQLKG